MSSIFLTFNLKEKCEKIFFFVSQKNNIPICIYILVLFLTIYSISLNRYIDIIATEYKARKKIRIIE